MTISEYNDSAVVGSYEEAVDSIGLWESEKLIFGKYLRPGMKILDIGCGAGRTTFNLYKLGYRDITGFDLSAAMIAACKKRAANESCRLILLSATPVIRTRRRYIMMPAFFLSTEL